MILRSYLKIQVSGLHPSIPEWGSQGRVWGMLFLPERLLEPAQSGAHRNHSLKSKDTEVGFLSQQQNRDTKCFFKDNLSKN